MAEAVRAGTGLAVGDQSGRTTSSSPDARSAGILAEMTAQGRELQFVVVGIGVNLRQAGISARAPARVTSIEAETTPAPDRALMLAENRCGDRRAIRGSACRKVRCYSERLARWRLCGRAPASSGSLRTTSFAASPKT